jgi:hypothetical protein
VQVVALSKRRKEVGDVKLGDVGDLRSAAAIEECPVAA